MIFEPTGIDGLWIIKPRIFEDDRGYFFESYNKSQFDKNIIKADFIQDNEARSTYGVLRGLHFQTAPYEQAKLVRVIEGSVLDVVVDLRKGSETYGQHFSIELDGREKTQLFVPRGFAHGYIVLSPKAVFAYKVDNHYSKAHEQGIRFNDPFLNINWQVPEKDVILSEKDAILPFLNG